MTNAATYSLLDSGNFQKLEQVGPFKFVRPAAQAVWRPSLAASEWQADATFTRLSGGDGKWQVKNKKMPPQWTIQIGKVKFVMRLTDFGHLGVFAEQSDNWAQLGEHVAELKKNAAEVRVLNLFAYTGGSTIACAKAGANVVHLDASKTSVAWARENATASGAEDLPIRWIVEDVQKFVTREIRRESKYHGIILDPPSYGRGSKNEIWNIEEHLPTLLDNLKQILVPDACFILLSAHSPGFTPMVLENLLVEMLGGRRKCKFQTGEMVLHSDRYVLPSGAYSLLSRS